MDDTAIDERTRTIITNAFRTEDEPMIAACQAYMDGREFFSLQPLYLETDYAGTRCRRAIEKRIVDEKRVAGAVEPHFEAANRPGMTDI
eukprot:gene38692-46868_t